MNKFRKGDKVTAGGREFIVDHTTGDYVYYECEDGFMQSIHKINCTLVYPFAVGDYVRSISISTAGVGVVTEAHGANEYTVDFKNIWYKTWRETASNLELVSRAGAVEEFLKAGKKIEAIKEYRMIHGVGLKEAKDAVEAMPLANDSGPTLGDILNTALSNQRKYKVGDKVVTKDDETDIGTVTGYRDGLYSVRWKYLGGGNYHAWRESELTPAKTTTTIVVRKDDGIDFRPSDKPRIHETVEEAVAEAERLAKLNPGVEFATFTLVSTSSAPKPVTPTVTTVRV